MSRCKSVYCTHGRRAILAHGLTTSSQQECSHWGQGDALFFRLGGETNVPPEFVDKGLGGGQSSLS